jgi:[protein-PII] uridylyltransferase
VKSATTRSDVSSIDVRDQRAALIADPSQRGYAFGRAYASLIDEWIRGLVALPPGVAVVAIGGYGREELAPASDLDVMLLHDRVRDVDAVADRLWYPIWDAGFSLDHSVRTVKQALRVGDDDLKAALGLLDARHVAGDAALVDELTDRIAQRWPAHGRAWWPTLTEGVATRAAQAGSVAFLLEPDLK